LYRFEKIAISPLLFGNFIIRIETPRYHRMRF
jgi:hypothetical protein